MLKDSDWNTLVEWWDLGQNGNLAKDFLPDNGTGGIMLKKKVNLIVAGFLYYKLYSSFT